MCDLIKFKAEINLDDFTLLIPSVSVGNVGQLTVDLLISTYNFKKVATLWHPAIIPAVGHDPFDTNSKQVCVACELYANEELKIATIQLRSSIDSRLSTVFFTELRNSIIKLKFSEVIVLASTFAYELHDIDGGHFRYISNDDSKKAVLKDIIPFPMDEGSAGKYYIAGSGFAVELLESLNGFMKVTVLIKYTSEGDNRPDALQMLRIVKDLIQISDKQIQIPPSWILLFGNSPPIGIY